VGEELALVRKLAYDEHETWHWSGKLVERGDLVTIIDAVFNGGERDLGYMKLEKTDLYHEFYYAERWFNVFQVFRSDGLLKGWYCNICKPARLSGNEISFVDMVLDVFVYPDGRSLVLDEEEFKEKAEAVYSSEDSAKARKAVAELLEMVRQREHPFDGVQ
jgi:protein associated with RNAse G/E